MTEHKPLSLFVKQKTPEGGGDSPPKPTSSDVKQKLIEVLDSLQDTTTVAQLVKAINQPGEQSAQAATQPNATSQTPKPWEGISEIAQSLGINLGELWKTREEELKAAREAADATSQELHELRLREIDRRVQELQAMADKVAQGIQTGQGAQGQKGFLEKLDELTQGFVSQKIADMFGGGDGKPQTPADPVDEFFHRLDQVDKIKERFGNPSGGTAQALAQSGVRGEILKLLLEDERDRLKMQYDHEGQVERNKHLGVLASTVKENLSDGVRALTLAAQEVKGGTSTQAKPESPQEPKAYECPECQTRFTVNVPPGAKVDQVGCPSCGAVHNMSDLEKS